MFTKVLEVIAKSKILDRHLKKVTDDFQILHKVVCKIMKSGLVGCTVQEFNVTEQKKM